MSHFNEFVVRRDCQSEIVSLTENQKQEFTSLSEMVFPEKEIFCQILESICEVDVELAKGFNWAYNEHNLAINPDFIAEGLWDRLRGMGSGLRQFGSSLGGAAGDIGKAGAQYAGKGLGYAGKFASQAPQGLARGVGNVARNVRNIPRHAQTAFHGANVDPNDPLYQRKLDAIRYGIADKNTPPDQLDTIVRDPNFAQQVNQEKLYNMRPDQQLAFHKQQGKISGAEAGAWNQRAQAQRSRAGYTGQMSGMVQQHLDNLINKSSLKPGERTRFKNALMQILATP